MFHVAILTVRGLGLRGWAVLELLETDGDEKDCFDMCGVVLVFCFEEFCGAIVLAWSDQLIAIDVIWLCNPAWTCWL